MDRAIAARVERLAERAEAMFEQQHREHGEIREEDQEFFARAYQLVGESFRIADETGKRWEIPSELTHAEFYRFCALLSYSLCPTSRKYPDPLPTPCIQED